MEKGFIYIWHDTLRNKFYIGSHKGTVDDGYTGSGKYFINAYNKRPDKFKRRILEHVSFTNLKELHEREEYWLNMIKDEELSVKYYNQKKLAAGGDIFNTLSEEKKRLHRERSVAARLRGHRKWVENTSKEELHDRARHARSKVKNSRGGSMPGEKNPFYGKKHTEDTKKRMREAAIKRGGANRIREYKVVFPCGKEENYKGISSISEKFNVNGRNIQLRNFINNNKPIGSNRKKAIGHPLLGAKIHTI